MRNHAMLPNWRNPNLPFSAWLVRVAENYYITMHAPDTATDLFNFPAFAPDEAERLLDGYFQPNVQPFSYVQSS